MGVFAPVSWLFGSVLSDAGVASLPMQLAQWQCGHFPYLQLRGSAGFSPASHAQGESLRRANAELAKNTASPLPHQQENELPLRETAMYLKPMHRL